MSLYNIYNENGVIVIPNVIVKGDHASVLYKGILKNSGADAVYMHTGYGEFWDNVSDVRMKRTDEGLEAALPISNDRPLKLAFKDSANNWDNNCGRDYTFDVQSRQ
jgi:hypothetical protein